MGEIDWWKVADWFGTLVPAVAMLAWVPFWLRAERRRRAEEDAMLARLERVEAKERERGLL